MKMTNSTKSALLILLGIIICGASILYFAKPNFDERQAIEAECVSLQTRLDDLLRKEADRPKYEAGIVEYDQKYQDVLAAFPADLNQEITIMFLQGIKDNNDFDIKSLGLGEKEEFYTLGTGGATTTLEGGEAAPAEGEAPADAATTEEAAPTEPAPTEGEAVAEAGDDSLICYRANFPISYEGSYKSLKDVIKYVDTYSDRMTVDQLSIAKTDDDEYTGSMSVYCYSVEGKERPERSIDLNQVDIGVDNIFGGAVGTSGSANEKLTKYDDNDGSALETTYDFYTMINAASSDVSAKVVGQNGAGKDASVLSNSDNGISTIKYEIYETDGKNYCKYTLDDQNSYEAEITSAEDVKILVQSSERKNTDDQVKVKITVDNKTALPVYIKVSGDDTVSPRVNITKNGLVKVYQ
ncbi:MAG: hypothetical protein IJ232_00915 [Lachnospiraceae bacterium]|nr:hypothetical protein [Lachnospiraceae bacterium]